MKRYVMMFVATILLIVSLTCLGIFTVIEYAKNKAEENKINMVKQAVLDDCLDQENEDYLIMIQKCEVRASKFKDAEFYMAWVYTEEDGMEIMYVRYENGEIEVFEE